MSLVLSEMQQLMHELGPAMPEVEAVVQHEAGSWDIWFEGDVRMALDWQQVEPRLRLSMALGSPAEALASAAHQALLKANLAWSAEGAVRAAMCDSGQLIVLSEPALPPIDVSELALHLRRFVLQAAQFAAVVRPDACHVIDGATAAALSPMRA